MRNSGARAVVEGCGSNGCEYMTGGAVAILGPVGDNFAAGMTGGAAFVYDAAGNFADVINEDSVVWQRVEVAYWEQLLRGLVEEHQRLTSSKFAEGLLRDWDRELPKFWQIVPKDLIAIGALPAPFRKADAEKARA